jgi:cytochrome o ubiquinol oxidase subunit III
MRDTTIQPPHTPTTKRVDDKNTFGFWVYLMTDCVLFASLFATYAVLHDNTFGGPSGRDLFSFPFVLTETLILLTSSFTAGLALWFAKQADKRRTLLMLGITFVLGVAFLVMELTEFREFISEGNSWRRSGFLSAFFTLVGTHGLHITSGLLWMGLLSWKVLKQGITSSNLRKIGLLSLFWHFLDVIWIFIFTLVYLLGAI